MNMTVSPAPLSVDEFDGAPQPYDPQAVRELASILAREFESADNYHEELVEIQHEAFKYYEAQPFDGDERLVGRSRIILPDVQEAIDYSLQSVMRTFISGDRTIEFEATNEEDEEAADEATAAIDFNFMCAQDGYRILADGCFDGLLRKIGIWKTVCETDQKVERETVQVPLEALGLLPPDVEVEDVEDFGGGIVSATLKRVTTSKKFVDYAVPTHEFRFSPRARHEDEADYVSHVCEKTRSDLIEMGFDPEQVMGLPEYSTGAHWNDYQWYESELDRYGFDDPASTPALQKVLLHEEYAKIDMDGDGVAERVRCFRVENEILKDAETGQPDIETVEEQPFAVWSPYLRPHRLIGYSVADKVMDIQQARSYVARQLNDGMAYSNMPRPVVDTNALSTGGGVDTINDILNPIPGSPIRVPGGSASVQPFNTGFDVGRSLAVMEWMTGERESRTGITRMNQGLDADALNKTATGTALMVSQGQQQEEYVARNFANAISRLFRKKYRLMRSEGEPFAIKVDGKYKQIDPRSWPKDVNIKVNVGLGSNSKENRIAARAGLLGPMTGAMEQGMAGPEHAFRWMDGMARDAMLGKGSDFMYDPKDPEVQAQMAQKEQQPDPELVKVEMDQQRKMAEFEFDAQLAILKAEHDAEIEAAKIAGQIDTAQLKTVLEARIATLKADYEAKLKVNLQDQRMGGSVAS